MEFCYENMNYVTLTYIEIGAGNEFFYHLRKPLDLTFSLVPVPLFLLASVAFKVSALVSLR
jgi:hypothetical protein